MELNGEPRSGLEASAGLTGLLLAFALVIIITLGYFVWWQNKQSTDPGGDTIKSPQVSTQTE